MIPLSSGLNPLSLCQNSWQRISPRQLKSSHLNDGVNIIANSGKAAGQEVFHPHFHVIPRVADDKLLSLPASAKSMIDKGGACINLLSDWALIHFPTTGDAVAMLEKIQSKQEDKKVHAEPIALHSLILDGHASFSSLTFVCKCLVSTSCLGHTRMLTGNCRVTSLHFEMCIFAAATATRPSWHAIVLQRGYY